MLTPVRWPESRVRGLVKARNRVGGAFRCPAHPESSEVSRDRRARGLEALLTGSDPGVACGAATVLRVEGPTKVVEGLDVAVVLLHEERVDALGVLVALRCEVGGTQVGPRLDAVGVELDGTLEAGDRCSVVLLLVGGETRPQVGLGVRRPGLEDGPELLAGGAVVAEAVVGAAGDEPGGGHLFAFAKAQDRALRVGERLARVAELVVGGRECERDLWAVGPTLLLRPVERLCRLLGLAALQEGDAQVVLSLPRAGVGLCRQPVRLGGVGLASKAALQRAQLDERACLSGLVASGPGLLERTLERPHGVVDLALRYVYVCDERAHPVIATAGLELCELGQGDEALAGVLERLATAKGVVGVLGVELECGGVGLRGTGEVTSQLELTGERDVRLDLVVRRGLGIGLSERLAE